MLRCEMRFRLCSMFSRTFPSKVRFSRPPPRHVVWQSQKEWIRGDGLPGPYIDYIAGNMLTTDVVLAGHSPCFAIHLLYGFTDSVPRWFADDPVVRQFVPEYERKVRDAEWSRKYKEGVTPWTAERKIGFPLYSQCIKENAGISVPTLLQHLQPSRSLYGTIRSLLFQG
jgi:hypothetical protein